MIISSTGVVALVDGHDGGEVATDMGQNAMPSMEGEEGAEGGEVVHGGRPR